MNENEVKIFPLGDAALTIGFGREISLQLNNRVSRLEDFFTQNAFAGFEEAVPAYCSLTIFYNVAEVKKNYPQFPTAFDAVKMLVKKALVNLNDSKVKKNRLVEIPVCFGKEFALDLKLIAAEKNLKPEKVIEIFLGNIYRVFMLGFLPGFAYMGEVDERISVPRKTSPRKKVPEGSVGIAGKQTGIYSLASPGGWQIIGRTGIKLFTPDAVNPTFLRTGDAVKFYESEF